MALVLMTQGELSDRVGGNGKLALIASTIGALDAAATTAIDRAITDVSADVESELAGLGFDLTTPPAKLKDIGVPLIVARLFLLVWGVVPSDVQKAADAAQKDLAEIRAGTLRIDGAAPAAQVASKFSWRNVADCPSDDNPRQTVRARMRRLP